MQRACVLTFLVVALLSAAIAETLDRIAATVGPHVITESQVLEDLRIAAFIDGKAPDLTAMAKKAAADRLIDQYLLLQDAAMTRTPLPGEADVQLLVDPIAARYGSKKEFQTALVAAGITEEALKAHLLAGLQVLRYTDLRFRPAIQVTEENLRDYYHDFVARRGQQGSIPSFEESRDQIEKLLIEERVIQALDAWLGMTRSEIEILYRDAALQ